MNNSNICPIIVSNPGNVKNEIPNSLEHYKRETTQHILKYLPIAIVKSRKTGDKKVKKIISYIMTNDDLFNNIMTSIMMADFTHDKSKSSLKYWRSKNCLWTLNKTIYKNKNRPQSFIDSLDNERNEISDLSQKSTPLDEVLSKEDFMLKAARIEELSVRDKQIIKMYYEDNLNEGEIGKKFGCTQQRISKIIIRIKKKINYE